MSFFSGNTFSDGGYSCARHDTALVRGIEVPADQAALALAEAISECDAVLVGASGKVLYLELGVGNNTPVIIKYPFWDAVKSNSEATYACVNRGEACSPRAIADRSILIDGDIGTTIAYFS